MLHFLYSFTVFIIALGILITVHELGHFWLARCCGVTVERFSIGFGRALWRKYDKRATEYVIAAIPLGGYVKMLDEQTDTVPPERLKETFNHKTIWQRAIIIVAGPAFNFLFAIVIYWLVFMIGMPSYRPIIGDIIPNSIVAKAEILPGMELKSIDDIEIVDWDTVRLHLFSKVGNSNTRLGVASFGSSHIEEKTLDLRSWSFDPSKQDPIITLGIIPLGLRIEPVLAEILPGSAAMKAGLKAGDKIIKVDGQQVNSWYLFMKKIRENPGRILKITVEQQNSILEVNLTPDIKLVNKDEDEVEGFAGMIPKVTPFSPPEEYKTIRQLGLLQALTHASEKTWCLMQLTVSMLAQLIIGDIKLNIISGPISIAQGAGVSAEYGFIYYLMFLALISINLGIINMFPLPVLDGGRLLFLLIEKIKGRPVSEKILDVSYRISWILLMLLMGLALVNDFSRL